MTIVCALFDPGEEKFHLGSNSASMVGSTILPESETKWARFSDWAIAVTGPGLADNAMKAERAKFPTQTDDINKVMQFMRAVMEKYAIGEKEEGYQNFGFSGLLVHRSGLFYDMDSKMALSPIPPDTLWARGSGMEFALGADEVSKLVNFSPEKRIKYAVTAAVTLDCDCPGEVITETF